MGFSQICNIFAKKNLFFMKVLGLGNALTDVLAMLPSEECIAEIGLLKGGMQLIDEDKLLKIMSVFEDFDTVLATGGSAANAISGLTRMGLPGGFIGKTGPDSYGKFYHDDMEKTVSSSIYSKEIQLRAVL